MGMLIHRRKLANKPQTDNVSNLGGAKAPSSKDTKVKESIKTNVKSDVKKATKKPINKDNSLADLL